MKFVQIIWLMLYTVASWLYACEKNDSVIVTLSFQRNVVSTRSITASMVYPVIEIHNRSGTPIYLYKTAVPEISVDSVNHKIIVDYSIERLPEGLTYYEFVYPQMMRIPANSSVDLYCQIQLYDEISKIRNGKWEFVAKFGYLTKKEEFLGFIDHGLRDQIVNTQKKIESNSMPVMKVSN